MSQATHVRWRDRPFDPRQQVPWKTFASGKASLQVSGLTLVLEPLGSTNYDDEIERGLRDAIFAKKQVGANFSRAPPVLPHDRLTAPWFYGRLRGGQ